MPGADSMNAARMDTTVSPLLKSKRDKRIHRIDIF
jgi:hypothetical protein